MATAIGVVSGLLTIFSFTQDLLPDNEPPAAKFNLYLGNDGAREPSDINPDPDRPALSDAGGEKPDVRIWSEVGEFLGIEVNDGNTCVDGSVVCETQVNDVERAPTYALFTANNDAICISWIGTTWPNGLQYGNVIGNWAETCSEFYGVTHATWFWSEQFVQREDGGSENVKCVWIDGDGDQPTTGIQIHWPDFDSSGFEPDGSDAGAFCNNPIALNFHTEPDVNYGIVPVKKRNMFARNPSYYQSPAEFAPGQKERRADSVKRQEKLNDKFSETVIKSNISSQTASYVCNSKGAAGPSFVSYEERLFCHMPTKTTYPFCDDVDSGNCWDDGLNTVSSKGASIMSSLSAPVISFQKVKTWNA